MIQEKKSPPVEIESENQKEKLINLRDFKYGDKYLTRNDKKATLWRQWYDVNHKTKFFVYGAIGKTTVGIKTNVWDEKGKCIYNYQEKELQNDPTLDLVEKIEEKHKK